MAGLETLRDEGGVEGGFPAAIRADDFDEVGDEGFVSIGEIAEGSGGSDER